MKALSIRFGTALFLHLLLDMGKVRAKGKASDPSNRISIGEGRRPTLTSKTKHLSKLKPDFPANRPRTMGAEFMRCRRRKQRMLLML